MDKVVIKRGEFLINLVFLSAILCIVFFFFKYAFGWIAPFVLGLFVTLMVEPVINLLTNKVRVKRTFAAIVITSLFWIIIGYAIYMLFNMLVNEIYSLSPTTIASNTKNFINSLNNRLFLEYNKLPASTQNIFHTTFNKISDSLTTILTGFFDRLFIFITSIVTSVPNVFIFITAAIMSSFFFSIDYPRIRRFITMQIPVKHYAAVVLTRNFIFNTLFKLIKAYSIIMLITFCILLVGLKLIGVQYVVLIASLIVLVDALPILGCSAVLIPWGIISIIMGDLWTGIWIFVLTVVVWITRQITEPRIVGHHLGLHPIVTLISMYVGLLTFGLFGVFLFPIAIMFLSNMQELGHLKIWKTEADYKDKPHPSQNE